MRQNTGPEFLVRTLSVGYQSGTLLEHHAHDWAQLVYASEGVMTVQTDEGTWVVPSHRAVWIPAGVGHSIAMSGWVSMRTLYLLPRLVGAMPPRCCVVAVPPLLGHLVMHVIAQQALRRAIPEHRRLAAFLVDQLRAVPAVPLELPLPRDGRALRVAVRLREDPGATAPVEAIARDAGASRRTLERIFQNETGMSFGRWRQQARLLHALRLLARGESVTSIALEVGYESVSAFISAFSSVLGITPGRYYREQKGRSSPQRHAEDAGDTQGPLPTSPANVRKSGGGPKGGGALKKARHTKSADRRRNAGT